MPRAKSRSKIHRCPICAQIVSAGEAEFPFCSERCRTIDLGKWASGAYRISSPVLDPEVLEDLGKVNKDSTDEDE